MKDFYSYDGSTFIVRRDSLPNVPITPLRIVTKDMYGDMHIQIIDFLWTPVVSEAEHHAGL